jgi:hypothetical protein
MLYDHIFENLQRRFYLQGKVRDYKFSTVIIRGNLTLKEMIEKGVNIWIDSLLNPIEYIIIAENKSED